MEHPISRKIGVAASAFIAFAEALDHAEAEDSSSASDSDQDQASTTSDSVCSSFTSVESFPKPLSNPPSKGLSGSALQSTHLSPRSTFLATPSTPISMDGKSGDTTPLPTSVPHADDPDFLWKLEAAMLKLSVTQEECSKECLDSRNELKAEFMAEHAKQSALFEEKMLKGQENQEKLQGEFRKELLKEQREHGALISGIQKELEEARKERETSQAAQRLRDDRMELQYKAFTKQLAESTDTLTRERKEHSTELAALAAENASIVAEFTALSARCAGLELSQIRSDEDKLLLAAAIKDVQAWLLSKVMPTHPPIVLRCKADGDHCRTSRPLQG